MRPKVVQRTVVLMSFDDSIAVELQRQRGLPWLDEEESALLLAVDARAFRTDALRTTRLFAALLEELPVSVALTGVEVARGFFTCKPFHHAILTDRLLVDAFADWLLPRAGPTALLEQAIALARRHRARRRLRLGALARAPGVELARLPTGTLASFAASRADLQVRAGEVPLHEAVAAGARVPAPVEQAGLEHVVVIDAIDGARGAAAPGCSVCADDLFSLLAFARDGRSRVDVIQEARRLGADDDAQELVDDLVGEGLLREGRAPSM